MLVKVVTDPLNPLLVYEVAFKNGKPQAVARDPHGAGRNGKPIDLWWRLKGPPSKRVQQIIKWAEQQ